MEYKNTFTGTFQLSEECKKMLDEMPYSKEILIVERSKGFMEIHSETSVEYTTEDIARKGL